MSQSSFMGFICGYEWKAFVNENGIDGSITIGQKFVYAKAFFLSFFDVALTSACT